MLHGSSRLAASCLQVLARASPPSHEHWDGHCRVLWGPLLSDPRGTQELRAGRCPTGRSSGLAAPARNKSEPLASLPALACSCSSAKPAWGKTRQVRCPNYSGEKVLHRKRGVLMGSVVFLKKCLCSECSQAPSKKPQRCRHPGSQGKSRRELSEPCPKGLLSPAPAMPKQIWTR